MSHPTTKVNPEVAITPGRARGTTAWRIWHDPARGRSRPLVVRGRPAAEAHRGARRTSAGLWPGGIPRAFAGIVEE